MFMLKYMYMKNRYIKTICIIYDPLLLIEICTLTHTFIVIFSYLGGGRRGGSSQRRCHGNDVK